MHLYFFLQLAYFFQLFFKCQQRDLPESLPSSFSGHQNVQLWVICSANQCHFFTQLSRWSSLQKTRSRGRGWTQIQLLPPYINLNLPISTPWPLNPPISTPKPTNLHPLDVDPTTPPGSCVLQWGATAAVQSQWRRGGTNIAVTFYL